MNRVDTRQVLTPQKESKVEVDLQRAALAQLFDHSAENLAFRAGSKQIASHSSRIFRQSERKVPSLAGKGPRDLLPLENTYADAEVFGRQRKHKKCFDDLVTEIGGPLFSETYLQKLSTAEIVGLMLACKETVLSLQLLIEQCSQSCFWNILRIAHQYLRTLIIHKCGSYLIQRLVIKDASFQQSVIEYSMKNFKQLALNEYGSRVLQRLVEANGDFRAFALDKFKKSLKSYTSSFSTVFLASAVISLTENEEAKSFIVDELKTNPKMWMSNKYFKRILVSYIFGCPESTLDSIYSLISYKQSICSLLNDKYSTLLLFTFLDRKLKRAESDLLQSVTYSYLQILQSEYLGYLLSQLDKRCRGSDFMNILRRNFLSPLPYFANLPTQESILSRKLYYHHFKNIKYEQKISKKR